MATVSLRISPLPAHVRTARLIATAVARRSGVDDAVLDEIRLAVGEACSRAVGLHQQYAETEPVTLLLDDEGRFVVTVVDRAPVGAEPPGEVSIDVLGDDSAANGDASPRFDATDLLPAGFGLAVIGGLVDDLEVSPSPDGPGTRVSMSWPLGAGADRGDGSVTAS